MKERPPLLTVEHLSMRFGGLLAIDDVSFVARKGDITAIIGPNGAGKTTVFNCLTGFYKPRVGRLALQRDETHTYLLERMEGFRIAREAGVARTFQNIRLFAGMSVLENLIVAQHVALQRASMFTIAGLFGLAGYRRAERVAVDLAKVWLDRVGLTDQADKAAGALPYGSQRRLEIARAMCTQPSLLCLDEPAAELNPRKSQELNQLLLDVRRDTGVSVLLIEHDMSVVMGISDHIVVLDHGSLIADGTPAQVRSDEKVIRAYLGAEEDEDLPPEVQADVEGALMLSIRGLESGYGRIQALRGIDLDIAEGEIVTLIGANGAGKTTLLMTMCGKPRASKGSVIFDGTDLTRMPTFQIVRRGIAHSPEGRRIFPRLTVLENLHMGAVSTDGTNFNQDLERILVLFPLLKERLTQRGGTLSGGEQQMLAIGRALMSRPRLLLLDEPSLGLAPLVVRHIFQIIREINRDQKVTVFLVEQNAFHALRLAHRAYVMVQGRITMTGTGAQLLADEKVRAAYLEGGSHTEASPS